MPKFNYIQFNKAFIDERFKVASRIKRIVPLRELSKEIKVSPATLSRLSNGNKLDINSILKVCDWIGVEIQDFIK